MLDEKRQPSIDVESGLHDGDKVGAPVVVDESGAVHGESFAVGTSLYARMQRFVGRFGIEQRGIERVPEDERTDKHTYKVGTLWLAANMVVSSFAIGALAGPVFYLGFVDALLTILFFTLISTLSVAFFSTFGPRFGLRQMVLSRYFFGYYGAKLIAFFNILACLGWSAVNVIVGAQLINAVNPRVTGEAGIIIIAVCTFIITLFGYKVVHLYEFWSWIPSFIIFMIVLGVFAHSGAFVNIPMSVGSSEAASVLSFGSVVYGFGVGWTAYAADYTVYQPVNASRKALFSWTWIGLLFPLLFTEWLGLAVSTAIDPNDSNNPYTMGYDTAKIGGLLGAVLVPPLGGFGQFCLVIMALSIIANNCPNIYSVSLSLQILARWTQAVPRFLWTLLGTIVYCAIAMPGYYHFVQVLQEFMDLIAYWLAIYVAVSICEHFVFKRGTVGYDVTIWKNPRRLPPGIAAVTAFLFGVLGAVMGMAQPWFVGPIGVLIGDPKFGGDIGFELAFAFTAVTFIPLRFVERRWAGR